MPVISGIEAKRLSVLLPPNINNINLKDPKSQQQQGIHDLVEHNHRPPILPIQSVETVFKKSGAKIERVSNGLNFRVRGFGKKTGRLGKFKMDPKTLWVVSEAVTSPVDLVKKQGKKKDNNYSNSVSSVNHDLPNGRLRKPWFESPREKDIKENESKMDRFLDEMDEEKDKVEHRLDKFIAVNSPKMTIVTDYAGLSPERKNVEIVNDVNDNGKKDVNQVKEEVQKESTLKTIEKNTEKSTEKPTPVEQEEENEDDSAETIEYKEQQLTKPTASGSSPVLDPWGRDITVLRPTIKHRASIGAPISNQSSPLIPSNLNSPPFPPRRDSTANLSPTEPTLTLPTIPDLRQADCKYLKQLGRRVSQEAQYHGFLTLVPKKLLHEDGMEPSVKLNPVKCTQKRGSSSNVFLPDLEVRVEAGMKARGSVVMQQQGSGILGAAVVGGAMVGGGVSGVGVSGAGVSGAGVSGAGFGHLAGSPGLSPGVGPQRNSIRGSIGNLSLEKLQRLEQQGRLQQLNIAREEDKMLRQLKGSRLGAVGANIGVGSAGGAGMGGSGIGGIASGIKRNGVYLANNYGSSKGSPVDSAGSVITSPLEMMVINGMRGGVEGGVGGRNSVRRGRSYIYDNLVGGEGELEEGNTNTKDGNSNRRDMKQAVLRRKKSLEMLELAAKEKKQQMKNAFHHPKMGVVLSENTQMLENKGNGKLGTRKSSYQPSLGQMQMQGFSRSASVISVSNLNNTDKNKPLPLLLDLPSPRDDFSISAGYGMKKTNYQNQHQEELLHRGRRQSTDDEMKSPKLRLKNSPPMAGKKRMSIVQSGADIGVHGQGQGQGALALKSTAVVSKKENINTSNGNTNHAPDQKTSIDPSPVWAAGPKFFPAQQPAPIKFINLGDDSPNGNGPNGTSPSPVSPSVSKNANGNVINSPSALGSGNTVPPGPFSPTSPGGHSRFTPLSLGLSPTLQITGEELSDDSDNDEPDINDPTNIHNPNRPGTPLLPKPKKKHQQRVRASIASPMRNPNNSNGYNPAYNPTLLQRHSFSPQSISSKMNSPFSPGGSSVGRGARASIGGIGGSIGGCGGSPGVGGVGGLLTSSLKLPAGWKPRGSNALAARLMSIAEFQEYEA